MKANELREKSVDQLNAELNSQLEARFKLRMQQSTAQLQQSHKLKEVRRDIARIKTLLAEKAVTDNAGI